MKDKQADPKQESAGVGKTRPLSAGLPPVAPPWQSLLEDSRPKTTEQAGFRLASCPSCLCVPDELSHLPGPSPGLVFASQGVATLHILPSLHLNPVQLKPHGAQAAKDPLSPRISAVLSRRPSGLDIALGPRGLRPAVCQLLESGEHRPCLGPESAFSDRMGPFRPGHTPGTRLSRGTGARSGTLESISLGMGQTLLTGRLFASSKHT